MPSYESGDSLVSSSSSRMTEAAGGRVKGVFVYTTDEGYEVAGTRKAAPIQPQKVVWNVDVVVSREGVWRWIAGIGSRK